MESVTTLGNLTRLMTPGLSPDEPQPYHPAPYGMVIPSIAVDPLLSALAKQPLVAGTALHATGLWGSAARLLATQVAHHRNTDCLLVTAHAEQADHALDDLELFGSLPWSLLPAWEDLPGEGAGGGEVGAERLGLFTRLSGRDPGGRPGEPPIRIVAPVLALMQPTPTPDWMAANTLTLRPMTGTSSPPPPVTPTSRSVNRPPRRIKEDLNAPGSSSTPGPRSRSRAARSDPPSAAPWTIPGPLGDAVTAPLTAIAPDSLVTWLVDRGYERLDRIEEPGDLAWRGNILDLFIPGDPHPTRIVLDGDTIESIRRFDVGTQRSLGEMDRLSICPLPSIAPTDLTSMACPLDYLGADTLLILEEPSELQELAQVLRTRLAEPANLFSWSQIMERGTRFPHLHLTRFGVAATAAETVLDFGVGAAPGFSTESAQAVSELVDATRDKSTWIYCDTEGERERLREMVQARDPAVAPNIRIERGTLHQGFEWTRTRTLVLSHHELFHRQRRRGRLRRTHASRPLDSWLDLKSGDFVVHAVHGIAQFRGLKTMGKSTTGQTEEFLTLEFADQAVVHVPVSQIDLVQQYIGAANRRPSLSKLGGKRWAKTKDEVARSVADFAESLLRVQAVRSSSEGTAYPTDTHWQREFEAAFPFEETEDQLIVAREIRDDLIRPHPMDRLVCGDVGYGKTELAMRASFKVVEYGRQVAVLVPTTVLAEQHHQTFRERMAEYPFHVACLSRFRSPAEQKAILEQARRGRIDILIGTHRLLSRDVSFADLGLVIVDEEQRFGVEHKERLRRLRETVDVLTLTATPIPRTLHMAVMGLRDISALQTPPLDRRAVQTRVCPFDRSIIREAILRELNRDGQVFFVHNFVHSIADMAATVHSIVPEARTLFAHGQMGDGELEDVMRRFVRRDADVLVSTTIIESGIDIPAANTIFINRADRLGLADLHQLRGRVGRSNHRAYCYLLLPADRTLTPKAAKRLKTVEEFSELGAGFRIAMRDLEIRGAGNILGKEQSGQIAAVGYEMYCRLLEQAIRKLRNEPVAPIVPVQIDLDMAAFVPQAFVRSDRARMEVYRRIVTCPTVSDIDATEKDLVDAYGAVPQPVRRLLQLAALRVLARPYRIRSISLRRPDVVMVLDEGAALRRLPADPPGSVRIPDPLTLHLRLPDPYLEPDTLLAVLRRWLSGIPGAT